MRVRIVARRLATVVASPGPASQEANAGGVFGKRTAAVTISSLIGLGGAYALTHKFVNDREFRVMLRQDHSTISDWVEGYLLVNYAPVAWSKQVRIQDDLATGDPLDIIDPADIITSQSTIINIGLCPKPPTLSSYGRAFFRRFAGLPPLLAEPAVGERPAPTNIADSSAMWTAQDVVEPKMGLELHPVADDEEAGEPVGSLVANLHEFGEPTLDENAQTDAVRWGATSADALLAAWAISPPPDVPHRLHVPSSSARRFEQALVPIDASAVARTSKATSPGWAIIQMPAEMADESQFEAIEATLNPPQARQRRLEWLRVQHEFFAAEADALDANMRQIVRLAARAEGGGIALSRMQERRRRLAQRLEDLDFEKQEIQHASRRG